VKLLIDEDSLGTTLLVRLQTMGHEIIRLPVGTQDEIVFAEAQRLAIPILTANVGRKGRRDPIGLYKLAKERIPHHGVIGIFRPAPTHQLSNQQIVEAIDRLAAQEQQQPGTALRKDDLTRLNDFLSILD
jgi:hypothetical protein